MIAARVIRKSDLERAARINDAIAMEHGLTGEGALTIADQLGINILDTAKLGAEHALRRHTKRPSLDDAREATTHAFTMGALIALRAVEVVGTDWE